MEQTDQKKKKKSLQTYQSFGEYSDHNCTQSARGQNEMHVLVCTRVHESNVS